MDIATSPKVRQGAKRQLTLHQPISLDLHHDLRIWSWDCYQSAEPKDRPAWSRTKLLCGNYFTESKVYKVVLIPICFLFTHTQDQSDFKNLRNLHPILTSTIHTNNWLSMQLPSLLAAVAALCLTATASPLLLPREVRMHQVSVSVPITSTFQQCT